MSDPWALMPMTASQKRRGKKLPPYFNNVMKTLGEDPVRDLMNFGSIAIKPTVVLWFDEKWLMRKNEDRKRNQENIHTVNFYNEMWLETDGVHMFATYDPGTGYLGLSIAMSNGLEQSVYGRYKINVLPERISEEIARLKPWVANNVNKLLFAMWLLTQAGDERESVFTDENRYASLHELSGDETFWVPVTRTRYKPSDKYEAPEPGSSGITKREHDVCGHWRYFKNGSRTWVRSHKRGDPNKGTITKVYV